MAIVGACVGGPAGDSSSTGDHLRNRPSRLVLEMTLGAGKQSRSKEYELGSIIDVAVARDSTLWVLDGTVGDGTVKGPQRRQYAHGTFIRRVGRQGVGPGEYSDPLVWR